MSGTGETSRLQRALERLCGVALGVWVGAMLAIAFVAAPLVFGAVPDHIATKDDAARVIGPAFARIDWLGIGFCLVGLLVLARRRAGPGIRWRALLLGLLLVSAGTSALYLSPAITARTEPLQAYHRAATTLWMFDLVAGAFLMWRGFVPRGARATGPA